MDVLIEFLLNGARKMERAYVHPERTSLYTYIGRVYDCIWISGIRMVWTVDRGQSSKRKARGLTRRLTPIVPTVWCSQTHLLFFPM